MTEATDLIQRYLATWNESNPDARRAAIESVWAEDGRYLDPLTVATGHDAISTLIGTVQQQVPGYGFCLVNDVDAHHNVARFSWALVPDDGGESIAEGFDVVLTDPDGRIGSVLGFLDK